LGYKPGSRVEALLGELCVRYGYCLPPDAQEVLIADPPLDADVFVETVLRVEGRDPMAVEARERRELAAVVHDWLDDAPDCKGTRSGLPLTPAR
jgi:hypothetical protein